MVDDNFVSQIGVCSVKHTVINDDIIDHVISCSCFGIANHISEEVEFVISCEC